ncbi:VOC family protein [Xylophilus rhododendri]|uniref:VOC family protein n=1 Tax=Xylophilus rhododendri TaxID=2697032 RepID=A0A857JBR0_9BURK|nr:VOC family protein [Xylophilus rhododendri]QHJ00189.1 VOC family protein [Xylophilus rhododendri]
MTALHLDHLVVTTRFDLAGAAALFQQLGFTLSPMGRHSLGSINHVILFEGSYLELLGVPNDGGLQRQEVLDAPVGIDALVLDTADADALHDVLLAQGLPVLPVQPLVRPIERNGVQKEVRFRTLRTRPGTFEAGRLYYCQHLTPELVWLPEYMGHANGAFALSRLVVVADDPAEVFGEFAPWLGEASDEFGVEFVGRATYLQRHGALACDGLGRGSFLGAIHLRCRDLAAVEALLPASQEAIRFRRDGSGLAVRLVQFNCLLVFEGL